MYRQAIFEMTKTNAFIGLFIVVLLAIGANTYISLHTASNLRHDEQVTREEAKHTAMVQKAGEPTGVCLREAMRAALPALERLPGVEAPLAAYVRLQSARYLSVRCPDVSP